MWLVFTLISGFFTAMYYWGNQLALLKPVTFMFYRGFLPVVLLLPLLPVVRFIDDWHFYLFCLIQGGVISFIDYGQFVAMNKWGAKAVSSIRPFIFVLVFLFWAVIKPTQFMDYFKNPVETFILVTALSGVVYSIVKLGGSEGLKKVIFYMFPFLIGSACCDILNKTCMSYASEDKVIFASYFYILITGFIITIVNFFLYLRGGEKISLLFDVKQCKYMPVFLFLMGSMLFKNFAMFNTPNPSFVTAGQYSYIVWIILSAPLLQKFNIKTDYVDIKIYNVLILLVSVVLLVLL